MGKRRKFSREFKLKMIRELEAQKLLVLKTLGVLRKGRLQYVTPMHHLIENELSAMGRTAGALVSVHRMCELVEISRSHFYRRLCQSAIAPKRSREFPRRLTKC